MRCATNTARIFGFIVCVGLCLRSVRVRKDGQKAVADRFGCITLSDSEFYRANDCGSCNLFHVDFDRDIARQ